MGQTETMNASEAVGGSDYYSDEAATLGDRIAAARSAAGLTQAGLAGRLGVGTKVVSAWEHDRSEPRANRLTMLSGLLGVSVAWLLTGLGDGVAPPGEAETPTGGPSRIDILRPTPDLATARAFYADLLGCAVLETGEDFAVFDFFGHRLVAEAGAERVGGGEFRLRLGWSDWRALVERLRAANAEFAEAPKILNVGAPNEEGAFSLRDPGGAALGFRAET